MITQTKDKVTRCAQGVNHFFHGKDQHDAAIQRLQLSSHA